MDNLKFAVYVLSLLGMIFSSVGFGLIMYYGVYDIMYAVGVLYVLFCMFAFASSGYEGKVK